MNGTSGQDLLSDLLESAGHAAAECWAAVEPVELVRRRLHIEVAHQDRQAPVVDANNPTEKIGSAFASGRDWRITSGLVTNPVTAVNARHSDHRILRGKLIHKHRDSQQTTPHLAAGRCSSGDPCPRRDRRRTTGKARARQTEPPARGSDCTVASRRREPWTPIVRSRRPLRDSRDTRNDAEAGASATRHWRPLWTTRTSAGGSRVHACFRPRKRASASIRSPRPNRRALREPDLGGQGHRHHFDNAIGAQRYGTVS